MSQTNSYNDLPYTCRPVRLTHPNNLACKAMLFGLLPVQIDQCRVLEIGCGDGTNLLSLAQILPASQFVGIDNAQRHVDQGRATAREIECPNVELHAMSAEDLHDQFGKFDYILCHGVYSWVTPATGQQLLQAIRDHLNPHGVAYVSYNIYPGWHLRGMVREMLYRQTAGVVNPAERVQHARQYLDFLIAQKSLSDNVYASILKREQEILIKTPDSYLYHEHLEERNEPVYFEQFAERAASCGLQYVCEASFNVEEAQFSDELRNQLQRLAPNRIAYEQQVDFLCNGTFRRSLLCHEERSIHSQPSIHAVKQMHMRSAVRLEKPIDDLRGNSSATFRGVNGDTLATPHPLLKVCLATLAEAWPRACTLDEVQRRCAQLLAADTGPTLDSENIVRESDLAAALLKCHRSGFVEFNVIPPQVVTTIDKYPAVTRLARWQATHGDVVCNLMHEVIDITDFERLVISLLDGGRDYSELESQLVERVMRGDLVLQRQGESVTDRRLIVTIVQHSLAQTLKKLALLNCLC